MGNALMMRYAAQRGNRNEMYGDDEMRGEGRNEMRGMDREEMRYDRRNEMYPPEMRRRRDSRGRYMTRMEPDPQPLRYDGSDTGYPEDDPIQPGERGFKREGEFGNIPRRIPMNNSLYDGGEMGFGAPSNHYGKPYEHNPAQAGGASWSKGYNEEAEPLDRVTAERWVKAMENPENDKYPKGGRWSMEETNSFAKKVGMPDDEQCLIEFYAIMNARYMDDGMVLKRFGVTDPMAFAYLAKAWLEDADAVDDKAAKYYKYIVKKE